MGSRTSGERDLVQPRLHQDFAAQPNYPAEALLGSELLYVGAEQARAHSHILRGFKIMFCARAGRVDPCTSPPDCGLSDWLSWFSALWSKAFGAISPWGRLDCA